MKIARILKFNSLKGRRMNAQKSLQANLFLSDKYLWKTFDQHKRLCYRLRQLKLIKVG